MREVYVRAPTQIRTLLPPRKRITEIYARRDRALALVGREVPFKPKLRSETEPPRAHVNENGDYKKR